MGILFWRKAKDDAQEAWSNATQAKRLVREELRIMKDIEHHVEHIVHEMPKEGRIEVIRKLDVQLDYIKRHQSDMRDHLKRLEQSTERIDKELAELKARKAA